MSYPRANKSLTTSFERGNQSRYINDSNIEDGTD